MLSEINFDGKVWHIFLSKKEERTKNRLENTEIYEKGCTLLKHLNTQSYVTLKLLTLIKEAFMKYKKVTWSENIFLYSVINKAVSSLNEFNLFTSL